MKISHCEMSEVEKVAVVNENPSQLNSNGEIIARGEGGKLLKGQVLNPAGRPKGSRNKLSEDFTQTLYEDFQANGAAAIKATREKDPATYVRVIASLLPKEVEFKRPLEGLSEEEIHIAIATLQAAMAGTTIDGQAVKVIDSNEPS